MILSRIIIKLLVCVAASGNAYAESLDVRGSLVSIPTPEGFTKATSTHQGISAFVKASEDSSAQTVAYYFSSAHAGPAAKGELPSQENAIWVKAPGLTPEVGQIKTKVLLVVGCGWFLGLKQLWAKGARRATGAQSCCAARTPPASGSRASCADGIRCSRSSRLRG